MNNNKKINTDKTYDRTKFTCIKLMNTKNFKLKFYTPI